MASSSPKNNPDNNDKWIPDGYEEILGPNGELYVVPEFMVSSLEQDYQAEKKKEELKAFQASGSVSNS